MAVNKGEIGIYGILRRDGGDNIIAKTDQLKDSVQNKTQEQINKESKEKIDSLTIIGKPIKTSEIDFTAIALQKFNNSVSDYSRTICAQYSVVDATHNNIVGQMLLIGDSLGHMVTEILTTSATLNNGVINWNEHSDTVVNTYIRRNHVKEGGNSSIAVGSWSTWTYYSGEGQFNNFKILVAKELNKKVNTSDVVQQTGDSTTSVMSQKAVSDKLSDLASRMTETSDTSFTPDLSIGDEDGNIIAQFSDGHIKTKNFDSSQIETLKPLKDKTFSILGDSISTYQGYLVSNESGYEGSSYAHFYPRYGVDNVNKTWWKKLEELSGMKILHNCSWSGSQVAGNSTSTTNAQVGCSNRRIADLGRNNTKPDIILILIGVNDLRNNDAHALGEWTANDELPTEGNVDTFSAAYALMVSKVLIAYPNSEVYCCTILDTGNTRWDTHDDTKYPCKNDRNNTTYQWNQKIKEVAKGLGANILNMHECGINYFNLNTFTGDRLHPNADGTTLMAKKAYSELLNKSKLVY